MKHRWAPEDASGQSPLSDIFKASYLEATVSIYPFVGHRPHRKTLSKLPRLSFTEILWISQSISWSRNSSHIKPADNAGNTGWCERDPLDQGEMARVRWRSKTKLRSLGNGDGVGWAESALLACTGFYGMHFNSWRALAPFPGNIQIISQVNTVHFVAPSVDCDVGMKASVEPRDSRDWARLWDWVHGEHDRMPLGLRP